MAWVLFQNDVYHATSNGIPIKGWICQENPIFAFLPVFEINKASFILKNMSFCFCRNVKIIWIGSDFFSRDIAFISAGHWSEYFFKYCDAHMCNLNFTAWTKIGGKKISHRLAFLNLIYVFEIKS